VVASHPDVIARLTSRWVNLVTERMAPVGKSGRNGIREA
jgi:hypothetical protein